MKEALFPIETEPADVLLDCSSIFGFFGNRVGVVESEVAKTVEFIGYSEVQTDTFCVPQVKISIGFGWKARMDASIVFSVLLIFLNPRPNEIERFFSFFLIVVLHWFVVGFNLCVCHSFDGILSQVT